MSITGKELIEMGYKPGKWFREALVHVNSQTWSEVDIRAYLDSIAPKIMEPYNVPVHYYKNIRAESDDERANVEQVLDTMDILMKTPTVVRGAVMPDACPTGRKGQIPVGGVVVAKNAIHPAMHSADICCSVMMTSLGHEDPKSVLDAAHKITHFGGGGRADHFDLPDVIYDQMRANTFLNNEKSRTLAQSQLGTQGDGNHFLYVGTSEVTGETVMVTHHGSRGLGAYLFRQGMRVAEGFRKLYSPATQTTNAWIPYDEEVGQAYWEALQIIRSWTKLNHQVLHQATYEQLGIMPTINFWNEHNFVFKNGDEFIHAKGATPLDDKYVPDSTDGLRIIPLNMSEPILIVKGESTAANLGFAPHGAGRNISRSQHVRKQSGRTTAEILAEETAGLDIRFYSGHPDISELPSAYKNAEHVQDQMAEFGLGQVVDRIMPYGCIMAGDWQKDAPWRNKKK